VIKPQPVGDVTWARASYDSVRGKIVTHWRREGSKFVLQVNLPANTTATVHFPAKSLESVRETGVPAQQSKGVRFLRLEGGCALFEVAGGQYLFETRLD
jgi:alpha-L-rhamnosidase